MTKEEVIELTKLTSIEINLCGIKHIMTKEDAQSICNAQIEKFLNLKYPCKTCDGKGYELVEVPMGLNPTTKCPDCKGTGEGEYVLGIIDPNQELPENPHGFTDREKRLHLYECCKSCHIAQIEAMTTPKDGTVWMKVRVN